MDQIVSILVHRRSIQATVRQKNTAADDDQLTNAAINEKSKLKQEIREIVVNVLRFWPKFDVRHKFAFSDRV